MKHDEDIFNNVAMSIVAAVIITAIVFFLIMILGEILKESLQTIKVILIVCPFTIILSITIYLWGRARDYW